MTAPNVIRLDEIRRATPARAVSTPSDIAPALASCKSLLYIGLTPDGYINYGLSRVEYEDAVNMIKAAGYLIGELSKIIGDGSR